MVAQFAFDGTPSDFRARRGLELSERVRQAWLRLGRTAPREGAAASVEPRLGAIDIFLICVFLAGIYTNYTVAVSASIPIPSIPCGIAGLFLLWRRRDQLTPRSVACFLGLVALYLLSVVSAPDWGFLGRRTNGLVQLIYSLTIGYALFLTIVSGSRRQIGGLFLIVSLIILVGCLLELYGGLSPFITAVRYKLYPFDFVYNAPLRDIEFYGQIRPTFFASEPASVTFCYSLFTFLWMVTSRWRFKIPLYLALFAAGLFVMRGPTLLLMLLLLVPYMLFLASRRDGRLNYVRLAQVSYVSIVLFGAFFFLTQSLFAERLRSASFGDDQSFFYRVQGPALAGIETMKAYPFAGAGLTGEPFIEDRIVDAYARSGIFTGRWTAVKATSLVVNYFWMHWIYLGLVFGIVILVALMLWLRVLGVPSPVFCLAVWAIMGQASGAYVGPLCWAVMYLSGAAAILQQRTADAARPVRFQPNVTSLLAMARARAAKASQRVRDASQAAEPVRDNDAVQTPAVPAAAAQETSRDERTRRVARLVKRLASRLRDEPADRTSWLRLARVCRALGNDLLAQAAYGRADALGALDPRRLADWAETYVRNLPPDEPPPSAAVDVLNRLEKAQPRNALALMFLGAAAYATGDKLGAVRRWTTLVGMLPEDAPLRTMLEARLRQMRSFSALS